MKLLFMGRKPLACAALEYVLEKQIQVVAVVAPPRDAPRQGNPKLTDIAEAHRIPVIDDKTVYRALSAGKPGSQIDADLQDLDLAVSFLFWRRIMTPLIKAPRAGCINFHAAPTPPMRGVCAYSFGVYWKMTYWGATAHFIDDEAFDTGDIIRRVEFPIDPRTETALSLERKSQPVLLELFKEVIDMALQGPLPRTPQVITDEVPYCSQPLFEELKMLGEDDSAEDIDRKIRAFWFPPYEGATLVRDGRRFTVINAEILEELAKLYGQ